MKRQEIFVHIKKLFVSPLFTISINSKILLKPLIKILNNQKDDAQNRSLPSRLRSFIKKQTSKNICLFHFKINLNIQNLIEQKRCEDVNEFNQL